MNNKKYIYFKGWKIDFKDFFKNIFILEKKSYFFGNTVVLLISIDFPEILPIRAKLAVFHVSIF